MPPAGRRCHTPGGGQPVHLSRRSRRPSPGRRRCLVSGLIILLPVVILAGAWRLGGVSGMGDDLIYYYPLRVYIGERLAAGEWPLWNPLAFMGSPVAADPQAGLWYPPTWLFAVLPPLWAYPLTIVLHFALAGGGMYRWLRVLGRDWRAALIGAIAFEFCGYLVAHRSHLTIHHAVAWLPWIFLFWTRFARTGRYRHFALAAGAFGLQMLVQHVQVSMMTGALLVAYVAVLLWPMRRGLWWQFPLGMGLGTAISAVQLLPTWLYAADSTRAAASYHLFVENSWLPVSAIMLLFPMFFGTGTPNLYTQPWWGISHFVEQNAYASILILLLAGASWRLLRSPGVDQAGRIGRGHGRHCLKQWHGEGMHISGQPLPDDLGAADGLGADGGYGRGRWHREVVFWWAAMLVALVIALGELSPVSPLLFQLPIYRNFRVPARWILVISVALPILAAIALDVVLRGRGGAARVIEAVSWMARRFLPVAAAFCLLLILAAWWQADRLEARFGHMWYANRFFAGLREAVRIANPAIWIPLIVMLLTVGALVVWTDGPRSPKRVALVLVVLIVDLATVAAFVDVDVSFYRRADLVEPPPLARAIDASEPRAGDRLLVPRFHASYHRPLEVLFPQSNMPHGVSTFQGYGPLWPVANRWLFRFMPWGSSEAIVELLRNTRLMQAMGVRFVAVRDEPERELLDTATMPALPAPERRPIPGAEAMTPVAAGHDLLWPVRMDAPGLYEIALDAEPAEAGAPSRWFVRLETPEGEEIDRTRSMEPADLVLGPRRLRFLYRCDRAVGPAFLRIKSERGMALHAGRATFGQVARSREPEDGAIPASFRHVAELPGDIVLYELPGSVDLLYWPEALTPVDDLREAIERWLDPAHSSDAPTHAVVTWPDDAGEAPAAARGGIRWERTAGHEILATAEVASEGLLVLNESYDQGWRAWIDGVETPVLRVNAVVQGIVVPRGHREIRFAYRPRGLTEGAVVSSAALVLLFLAGAGTRRARKT